MNRQFFQRLAQLVSGSKFLLGNQGDVVQLLLGFEVGHVFADGRLADVQRMPSLIGKFIAIPAMRDYNYRVVLDRDGTIAATSRTRVSVSRV